MSEQVLVIPRHIMPDFDGLFYGQTWSKTFFDNQASMMNRDAAENDPNFKQIIPYIIIAHPGLNKVVVYQRTKRAGEQRLHGKHSIGFGGHINKDENLEQAARRELEEETGLNHMSVFPIAWLNDDSTEVGQVHLGIVYVAILDAVERITKPGDEVDLKGWYTCEDLKAGILAYEHWSQICIRHLPKILSKA